MDLDKVYQDIQSELKTGARAMRRFNSSEVEKLGELLEQVSSHTPASEITQILCLVEHSAMDYTEWENSILRLFSLPLSTENLIYLLNCARKHIMQSRFKRGNRLDMSFLMELEKLLHHQDPEVVEWTLRTVEECGAQGVYFLKFLDKLKPAPWKWFNPHYRAIREIIELLERRWKKFEKD